MSVAKTRVLRWISENTQKNRIHNKEICLKIGWLLLMKRWERFARDGLVMFKGELESTDAVGRVPHPSPTRLPSRWCHVWASFFFFGFAPTRLDSRQFGFDSHRTGLIRPESGHISHISPYRPVTETAGIVEILTAEDRTDRFCLLLSLFCESRIVMCFVIIF